MARGPSLVDSCHARWQHCIAAQWNRYADCRSSWNFEEILRPSSRRKSTADSLIGPSVSTAIGWNENEAGRSEYLTSFLEAAASLLLLLLLLLLSKIIRSYLLNRRKLVDLQVAARRELWEEEDHARFTGVGFLLPCLQEHSLETVAYEKNLQWPRIISCEKWFKWGNAVRYFAKVISIAR